MRSLIMQEERQYISHIRTLELEEIQENMEIFLLMHIKLIEYSVKATS